VRYIKLTLVVPYHRELLVGRAESRREQAHRIADCSLAAGSSAVADHSSPGYAAVEDNLAADSHSGRILVAEHRTGPAAGPADNLSCIDRMGLTSCLCKLLGGRVFDNF
jgi:hypothetical protein